MLTSGKMDAAAAAAAAMGEPRKSTTAAPLYCGGQSRGKVARIGRIFGSAEIYIPKSSLRAGRILSKVSPRPPVVNVEIYQ